MDINLKELRYFKVLATVQNFTRASELLGMTQPALSSAIKRLEKELNCSLFIRHKKGAHLTHSGRVFLERAKKLGQEWDNVANKIHATENLAYGNFSIGCHASVAMYTIGNFLAQFLKQYPEIKINLFHDRSKEITQKIINYEIDFGIVINPTKHPDLILTKMGEDEVQFWKNSKANDKKPSILLADTNLLQTQKLLSKIPKNHFIQIIHTDSLEVITQLTYKQLGMGIIPSRVALSNYKNNELKPLKNYPSYKDSIYLVYRYDLQKTRAAKLLAKALASSLLNN